MKPESLANLAYLSLSASSYLESWTIRLCSNVYYFIFKILQLITYYNICEMGVFDCNLLVWICMLN